MVADKQMAEAAAAQAFSSSQLVESPDEHFIAEDFQQDHELDLVTYHLEDHHDQLGHEEQSQHHLFHHHYQPIECEELLQEANILQQHEDNHPYKHLAATAPNSRFDFCVEEPAESASAITDSDIEENELVAHGLGTCHLVRDVPCTLDSSFPILAGGDSSGGSMPADHDANENQVRTC